MASLLSFCHLIITLYILGAARLWLPELWRFFAPLVRSWLSRFELRLLYRGREIVALKGHQALALGDGTV